MSLSPNEIYQYILDSLSCDHLIVEGDGTHFYVKIVSPQFRGKSLIARHKLVYATLGNKIEKEIHAISMKTLTPEEYKSGKMFNG